MIVYHLAVLLMASLVGCLCELGTIILSTRNTRGGVVHSSIHRFFDTSPFSPCGQYVAFTRFRRGDYVEDNEAEIVVADVLRGTETVVGTSRAWGSQVGAHVQWGAPGARNESLLYFGDIRPRSPVDALGTGGAAQHLVTIVYSVATGTQRVLRGPLYQVQRSGDNRAGTDQFLAAPELGAIKYTQRGYGVDHFPSHSVLAGDRLLHDGLFVTNTRSNRCYLMLSLYEVMFMVAKWPIGSEEAVFADVYGFHVKWSDDGLFLMFVVRTVHRYGHAKRRRQHLFVIDFPQLLRFRKANRGIPALGAEGSWLVERNSSRSCQRSVHRSGSVHPSTVDIGPPGPARASYEAELGTAVYYVVSWGNTDKGRGPDTGEGIGVLLDGNHPNFVAGSHKVVMNMESPALLDTPGVDNAAGAFVIVTIDVPALIADTQADANWTSDAVNFPLESVARQSTSSAFALYLRNLRTYVQEVYPFGTGHPTMFQFPGVHGHFVVTDSYLKELHTLAGARFARHRIYPPDTTPLASAATPIRLIDLVSQQEVWIADANVSVATSESSWFGKFSLFYHILRQNRSGQVDVSNPALVAWDFYEAVHQSLYHPRTFHHEHLNHWRCDAHVALSRDARMIAYNSIVDGERQVLVSDSISQGRRLLVSSRLQ